MKKKQKNDKVGYGMPPIEHRFQKGKSGNPKGRPPKQKNFEDTVIEELTAEVRFKDSLVSTDRLLAKSVIHRALKGHGPSLTFLLPYLAKLGANNIDAEILEPRMEDRRMLDDLLEHEQTPEIQRP